MKPFLGIDITTNRKNEQLNGNEFLILKLNMHCPPITVS